MQRKIQIYFTQKNNDFNFRVIDMTEIQEYEQRLDPFLARMLGYDHQTLNELIPIQLCRLNNVHPYGYLARELSNEYKLEAESKYEVVTDIYNRNQKYHYGDQRYSLPLVENKLLKLLVSLDSAIHTLLYVNGEGGDGDNTTITYCGDAPTSDKALDICHAAFSQKRSNEKHPKEPLSRYLVIWLIAELKKDANIANDNQALIERLSGFLESEALSLTPVIRQFLYPTPPVNQLIEVHCKEADTLAKELLNPECIFSEKTPKLLNFIKAKLATKPDKKITTDPLSEQENVAVNQAVHADIAKWFAQLDIFRKKLWKLKVESLYGKIACDGGSYTENYTEINLLKEANLALNKQGFMELNFLNTRAYRQYYSPGARLWGKLESEVRQSCADLDLGFLPNQDFHSKAIFDSESTARLKNMGFHYTEAFCKDELRKGLHMKQFNFKPESGSYHLFQLFPRDIKLLLLDWVNVAASQGEKQVITATSVNRI